MSKKWGKRKSDGQAYPKGSVPVDGGRIDIIPAPTENRKKHRSINQIVTDWRGAEEYDSSADGFTQYLQDNWDTAKGYEDSPDGYMAYMVDCHQLNESRLKKTGKAQVVNFWLEAYGGMDANEEQLSEAFTTIYRRPPEQGEVNELKTSIVKLGVKEGWLMDELDISHVKAKQGLKEGWLVDEFWTTKKYPQETRASPPITQTNINDTHFLVGTYKTKGPAAKKKNWMVRMGGNEDGKIIETERGYEVWIKR